MRQTGKQSVFILFLVIKMLGIEALYAQIPDSIEKAVNDLLNTGPATNLHYQPGYREDSMRISVFLAEFDRYQSINSDSSLQYAHKAIMLSLHQKSLPLISLSLQSMGDYCLSHEMYREAMAYYLKSMAIEERDMNTKRIADLQDALGSVYYYMEVFDKSLSYHQKALDIYSTLNDTLSMGKVFNHLGLLFSSREFCENRTTEEKRVDFQKAIDYQELSLKYSAIAGNEAGVAKANQNIAEVYNKLEKPSVALGYIQKAVDYYRRTDDPEGILSTLFILGRTYTRLKEYGKAIDAFKASEKMALERHLTGGIQYLYEAIAFPYYQTGDYRNAYLSYIQYMTIRDSVYNSEKSRQIIELETKYQSELRQKEIMRLKAEQKRRNALIYTLFAVVLLLVFSIYFHVRLSRKNRIIDGQNLQIKEDKIRELEQERLYLAARSVMEGEEAERTRLASDLHNGLGGLLSGIKINLSSMKENAVITHENVTAFNHALSLLDTSISELRRIAHNLMPETLNHYGLKTAIEDFCTQVTPSGKPELRFHFFGDEIRYTRELELTMYRVIQELVNNALKHSEATAINIQVFSESDRLSGQVTDNGKGFDISSTDNERKGKGIENIRDRITALNGKLEIWSQPGQGTEVSVEFEIH